MKSVFVSLMCALSLSLGIACKGQIAITPSVLTVRTAETFSLDIYATGVSDLYAFQFDVNFSPSILVANGVSEGTFLRSGGATFFAPGTIDNSAGKITLTANTLIGAVPGVNGSGNIARLTFLAQAVGDSLITLSDITLLDSSLNTLPTTATSSTITVIANVPEPSALIMIFASMSTGSFLRMYRRRKLRIEC